MVTCTRRGCGAGFDPAGSPEACVYHPGAPVFHEGLKSWSCCKEVNKPVMEFDQFMAIKGCTTAESHTTEKQALPKTAQSDSASAPASHLNEEGKEVFGSDAASASKPAAAALPITQPLSGASLTAAQRAAVAQTKEEKPEESDPKSADAEGAIPPGSECKRSGCHAVWNGTGPRNRSEEKCVFHKGVPIFHEGSKGWSCCKPKVLDFEDFLKIVPCTTSSHGHLYIGAPPTPSADAFTKVEARVDHYETPDSVRVSVYAKGASPPPQSSVTIKPDAVDLDLWLPALPSQPGIPRRVVRTLVPFASVDPSKSTFTIGKFKTDIVLIKAKPGVSWPALEAGNGAVGYGLTFGREVDAQHNGH